MKAFFSILAAALFASPLFAADGASSGNSFTKLIILMGLMFVFFYFILYRPEKKRRKIVEEQRAKMKSGDKVTVMGILGTIDQVKERTVIVKMVDGGKIEFLKAAVTDVHPPEGEPVEKSAVKQDEKS